MWREITEDDVLGVLSAQETQAYQFSGIQAGQDVLETVLPSVVQNVRSYIADNPENRLAPGNTLPQRCILPAMHMVRHELLTRLDQQISDARRDDIREARKFFERVAEGKVTIEKPDGDETAPAPTPRPGITAPRRNFSRRQQDGI
ncbi:MAG: phage protein Gp36 family protein [Luteolibacter sp.]